MSDDDLLLRAREEVFHAKVAIRSCRNQTKTTAAALEGSEQRIDALIAEIEARLNGSPGPKEAHGHDHEDHLKERMAAA